MTIRELIKEALNTEGVTLDAEVRLVIDDKVAYEVFGVYHNQDRLGDFVGIQNVIVEDHAVIALDNPLETHPSCTRPFEQSNVQDLKKTIP